MDIIIIGKASFQRNDKPVCVYCGQDRNEAAAAVKKAAGQCVRFYELNPEPHRPIPTPETPPAASENLSAKNSENAEPSRVEQASSLSPQPEPAQPEQPQKPAKAGKK